VKTLKDVLKQLKIHKVGENLSNIKAILKAAEESLAYKPIKPLVRTWNEELKQIIRKKY
jgi:hypothetical protein